jgi:hypothetical protein
MPIGLAASGLLPDHRVLALHILFIGGFSLLAFAVATHGADAPGTRGPGARIAGGDRVCRPVLAGMAAGRGRRGQTSSSISGGRLALARRLGDLASYSPARASSGADGITAAIRARAHGTRSL